MPEISKTERIAACFPAVCCVAVLASYLSNINSGPFEDDFGWIAMATQAAQQGWWSVWGDAFGSFFFRPFNMGLLALSLASDSWAPTHGVALGIHVMLAFAAAWLAARLTPALKSRWLILAAGCAFFVHQGAPATVLQLDTLSQSTSDFFSVAAVIAALAYASGSVRWLIVAAAASLLAMLGKEGGVSTPLLVAFTVAVFASKEIRLRKTSLAVATQVAAGAAYLLWRTNVRNLIRPPEEVLVRYDFGAGLETLRHLGQFFFVEVVPWNSASLLWNGRMHEWVIGVTLAVLVVIASGLGWKSLVANRAAAWGAFLWLLGAFVIWCTPFVFLSKVSEQETYRLAAIASLALSIGCWGCLRFGKRHLALFVLVIWCVWVGVGAIGSVQKSMLLRNNWLVVEDMLEEVQKELGDVSQIEELWVDVGPFAPPEERYSVLYVPDAALRWRAMLGLRWYLEKPSLEVRFFLPNEEMPASPSNAERLKRVTVDVVEGKAQLVP
jgi:hypothetical protein